MEQRCLHHRLETTCTCIVFKDILYIQSFVINKVSHRLWGCALSAHNNNLPHLTALVELFNWRLLSWGLQFESNWISGKYFDFRISFSFLFKKDIYITFAFLNKLGNICKRLGFFNDAMVGSFFTRDPVGQGSSKDESWPWTLDTRGKTLRHTIYW